jgi:S1-C subfamily serine protease
MSEYLDSTNWQELRGATPPAGPPPGPDPTTTPGAAAPLGTPAPSRRPRLLAFGSAFVAVAVATGAIGYAIGDHGATTRAFPPPYRFIGGGSDNPFGSFRLPGGTLPFNGGATSAPHIPAAVQRSEAALVDINTSIDGGSEGGAGTGVVLTSDGVVLTNNHVVDGATSISVTDLGNGQTYSASVIGYDLQDDVAVIQLANASGLSVATTSNNDAIGSTVYAVGNAGGSGGTPTVTSGKLTAVGQAVTASDSLNGSSETLHGMLETNAAIISGDSGGALSTANGKVLGIDTAGSSSTSGSNSGFAIPIFKAIAIANDIRAGTETSRIHIGPTALLGVFIDSQGAGIGALVQSVQSGGAAAGAGITAGSRITSIDGRAIATSAAMRTVMSTLRPGMVVRVAWVTPSGARHAKDVTLTSGPPQ